MKTKLLFGLFLIATLQFTNAQAGHTIGLVGQFNNWGNDTPPVPDDMLSTTDDINYTLAGWVLAVDGPIKFRQDQNWNGTAWGDGGWPSGTGNTGGGSNNINAIAGTWDVALNVTTGVYSFTASSTLAVDEFTKNIQFYYVNNALNINGYNGKASIKAYDIIGRLLYNKENVSIQNGFSQAIKLPENQVSIILIKGENFTKSLEVIAHQ